MPDSLLTILKFCFLALLYLFFLRVVRAVWAEMSGAPPAAAAPASAPFRPVGGGARRPILESSGGACVASAAVSEEKTRDGRGAGLNRSGAPGVQATKPRWG